MNTPVQPLIWLVVAIAGWIQRDQQAAIVYLLKENRVLKAQLRRRKLRLTDEERRRLAVKGKAGSRRSKSSGFWVKRHRVGASTGRSVVTMAKIPPSSRAGTRTNLSAYAFRFGLLAGRWRGFTPESLKSPRTDLVNSGSRSWMRYRLPQEETIPHVSEVSCHLLHPFPVWV